MPELIIPCLASYLHSDIGGARDAANIDPCFGQLLYLHVCIQKVWRLDLD